MSGDTLRIGLGAVTIEDVVAVAERRRAVALATEPAFKARIDKGAAFLERLLAEHGVIYGVTTGFGDSVTTGIPAALVGEVSHQLFTYHGCGLGAVLSPEATRAVLVARLTSLSRGLSGVRWALLEQLAMLLREDLLPVIPEEGSVGASGDLTPLSYVAAALCGEREVWVDGQRRPTGQVFQERGLTPLRLTPKEGLALMNGTAVMTALACQAFSRAAYLVQLASRLTAMTSLATRGNGAHFDDAIFAAKPHPGQRAVAAAIRADLPGESAKEGVRLQDRYSLRCAPHVIGVVADSLPWLRQFIETELNSANDNPLFDADAQQVLHGGNFYGGHIAFAMDSLKAAVASVGDLMDRQLALLVDARFNHGLPMNLTGAQGERATVNHGFKAVQIGASSWAAEALRLTMPAASFSRSTECHNQDKVSMGTIAARDALRVLELTEQVAAALLLASAQGVELRRKQGPLPALAKGVAALFDEVRAFSPFLGEDRALEGELRAALARIRARRLSGAA